MDKKKLRCLIGENMRRERHRMSMTLEAMSEALNLTPGFLGLMERGKRGSTAFMLYQFSRLCEISIDSLFLPQGMDRMRFVEEVTDPETKHLRENVVAMARELNEQQLSFLVDMIKGVKEMNHDTEIDNESEDDENY
jgi:transcriptional regulator with XRE-family HTH domain